MSLVALRFGYLPDDSAGATVVLNRDKFGPVNGSQAGSLSYIALHTGTVEKRTQVNPPLDRNSFALRQPPIVRLSPVAFCRTKKTTQTVQDKFRNPRSEKPPGPVQ
jgi:hypothetical protein